MENGESRIENRESNDLESRQIESSLGRHHVELTWIELN